MIVEILPSGRAAVGAPVVTDWDDSDVEWLEGRRSGLGGSDILPLLGFSSYTSPWEVWREKTGKSEIDTESPSEAATLGTALEPWLIAHAPTKLGVPVYTTSARTYAHPEHPWRRCSPDGVTADGRIVEAKTAGLASGFGTPLGWADDSVPLGYELQVRWSMHVMDAPAAEVVALVAGLGFIHRTIERDLAIEATMVGQISAWWRTHIVEGVEPPLGGTDAEIIAELYPRVNRESIDLDETDALKWWEIYLAAHERETAAKHEKAAAGAELKALIGDAHTARVEGAVIATWGQTAGKVNFSRLLEELTPELEAAGIEVPDPEDYRGAPGRRLNVKDLSS
jgi:putative phage-type endonuclease